MSYSELAAHYDRLMYDTDYEGWAAFLFGILRDAGVARGGRILETGCGTGRITLPLLGEGYRVTATDIDGRMLSIAAGRIRAAGFTPEIAEADMAALELPPVYSAVVCACDGVNYLNNAQVARFFAGAYAALKPGGVLTFDISREEKLKDMSGSVYCDCDEDFCYVWKNTGVRGGVRLSISLFVKEEDGRYQRREIEQTMYRHSEKKLREQLAAAGFEDITTKRNRAITGKRSQFIARKGE